MNESSWLPRATVDTNQFVSSFIRAGSLPDQILTAWEHNRYRLVTTPELTAEVADVLSRPRLRDHYPIDADRVLRLTRGLAAAEQALPMRQLPLTSRDSKDNKVLACALGGQVDYLVTGDKDLLVLNGQAALGMVRIVTPREFLTILGIEPQAGVPR